MKGDHIPTPDFLMPLREGFFDTVRQIVVRCVVRHWNMTGEPLGIGRGTEIVIQFIADMKQFGDPLTGEKWPYARVPDELTVKRRFNEAASIRFYDGKPPPLECIGRHLWMGELESQYRPRL